jgi:lycopene beta-cyclase
VPVSAAGSAAGKLWPVTTSPSFHQGDVQVDVAIVGAGGAGLSLLLALEAAARRRGVTAPTVAVIDPVHRAEADRTWCWWAGSAGSQPALDGVLPLARRTWSRMELVDRAGVSQVHELGDLRYVMLRSSDFYAAADAAAARLGPGAIRLTQAVSGVDDGVDQAVVHTADGGRIQARWVFDSRPAGPSHPGSTRLLQHFRGWTVHFEQPQLDPGLATLMDFQVPQPERGVAFGYCLPLDERRALVEYTEFSRTPLPSAQYDAALRRYLAARWQVEPGSGVSIEGIEDGVIPMTDARYPRRTGRRVFRLGTAGGATRPSTGYTFVALQRQASAVAELLLDGRTPLPPRPYPARHRWLDAVLLRALDRGYVPGPELFTGLFAANPSARVVRFLDGRSGPADELAVMRSAPMLPMIRATIEDAAARTRRRLHYGDARSR